MEGIYAENVRVGPGIQRNVESKTATPKYSSQEETCQNWDDIRNLFDGWQKRLIGPKFAQKMGNWMSNTTGRQLEEKFYRWIWAHVTIDMGTTAERFYCCWGYSGKFEQFRMVASWYKDTNHCNKATYSVDRVNGQLWNINRVESQRSWISSLNII